MRLLRTSLVVVLLAMGAIVNTTISPQIYVPRPPIANGIDIASTWEWRSMAIREHSWWLSHYFPGVSVTHVAYGPPPTTPGGLDVGIQFASWRDRYLDIRIDDSLPPLDVSALGLRELLIENGRVFSRIHCRDNQQMTIRDSCFYFVAWDDELLADSVPTFVAVRTNLDDDSEYALVEQNLLENTLSVDVKEIPNLWEVSQ